MIVLRKKRITVIILMTCISVGIYLGAENLFIKEEIAVPTVALPVNNKVIIIDAGHRKARWRGSPGIMEH